MHQVPHTEISCQEEESIHQLLFTDICQQEGICQLYFPGICWQEEGMHHSTFTDTSCRKQRSIYQLPFREVCTSYPLLMYQANKMEVCTSYPLLHMLARRKYTPATLYWHTTWHKSFTCMYHGCKHKESQYIYKLSLTAINKCQCSHWYSNLWLDEIITDCS